MNNGRTKNGITHCTMIILHGRRTNVKCTEARLQKEEMECNKVKLELKQEYQWRSSAPKSGGHNFFFPEK